MSGIIGRVCAPTFIIMAVAGVASANAQTTTSLADVYAALDKNPRVEAAASGARAAELRVASAKKLPDPQVQLGFMNYTLPGLSPMPAVGMTQLQVMQMLPLGGKLSLNGQVAAARASAATARLADMRWQVRAEAAMAFYELHAIDRNIEVDRQTLGLLADIEKAAASMYRVGEGRQTDVLKAQVELARMGEDTLRMQSMRVAMQSTLGALTLSADSAQIKPRLPAFPENIPSLQSLQMLAETRPMLRAATDELAGAAAAENLARKEIWPDVQVGVQVAQARDEMGAQRMGSLMVGASVPLFARSRQLQMRQEAAAMRATAEADVAAMRVETRAKVAAVHASLVSARNLSVLYRSTVLPQAEAMVSSAFAAYRAGSVDLMTLLDAQMTVNQYRQRLNALDAGEGKAWAELEMLVGQQLIDPKRERGKP